MGELREELARIVESQNRKDERLLRAEREFFTTHDHTDIISKYPSSIGKILVVNESPCSKDAWGVKSVGALFDFDALKLREAVQSKWKRREYETLVQGLNYLIDQTDQRWIFLYDIPPKIGEGVGREGKQMPGCYPVCNYRSESTSTSNESWMLTSYCTRCPEMFRGHDETGAFYSPLRFRPAKQRRTTLLGFRAAEQQARNALLGFFCRECDKHYEASELGIKRKWVFKGFGFDNFDIRFSIIPKPIDSACCPNGHIFF